VSAAYPGLGQTSNPARESCISYSKTGVWDSLLAVQRRYSRGAFTAIDVRETRFDCIHDRNEGFNDSRSLLTAHLSGGRGPGRDTRIADPPCASQRSAPPAQPQIESRRILERYDERNSLQPPTDWACAPNAVRRPLAAFISFIGGRSKSHEDFFVRSEGDYVTKGGAACARSGAPRKTVAMLEERFSRISNLRVLRSYGPAYLAADVAEGREGAV
jgi:hypothetical protein